MRRFCIEDFSGTRSVAMICRTKEEAETFLSYLDSRGLEWCDGTSYIGRTQWEQYEEDTAYYFNMGMFGNSAASDHDDTLFLDFSDYDWGISDFEPDLDDEELTNFLNNFIQKGDFI